MTLIANLDNDCSDEDRDDNVTISHLLEDNFQNEDNFNCKIILVLCKLKVIFS